MKLLVIVSSHLSALVKKGEYTPNYYNPGELADEVHILMTNEDRVDPRDLQHTVGRATLKVHNIPTGQSVFVKSLGWRPNLLRSWAKQGVDLSREIEPDIVRCYSTGLNAFMASRIKRELGVPYVVSLHSNPDVDLLRGRLAISAKEWLLGHAVEAVEAIGVKEADHVLPVYSPIVPYLKKHGVESYTVVFNAVGHELRPKDDYATDPRGLHLVSVGRQQELVKDPRPIVEAVARVEGVRLTLIGSGNLHEAIQARVSELGLDDRVEMIPMLQNHEAVQLVSAADVFIYNTYNYEICKSVLEAALAGLPIIHNTGKPTATELKEAPFVLVDGSAQSFAKEIERLRDDDEYREKLGMATSRHAWSNWDPYEMEKKVVQVYQRLVSH